MKRNPLPAEPQPGDVVVEYSGAEQLPWDLSPLKMRPTAIQTGDYQLAAAPHLLRIERKSLSDLVGVCGVERDRFERELERIKAFPARILLVEASWEDVAAGEWRSKIQPAAVEASLLSWVGQGINVVMAGDRRNAEKFAAKILYLTARRHYRQLRTMVGEMQSEEAEAAS